MGFVDRRQVRTPDGSYVSWDTEVRPSNLIPGAVKRQLNPYNSLVCTISMCALESEVIPTKIIFNGPATICFFADGTKEIVKKMESDDYDPEKAVLYCIVKHILRFKEPMYKEYGYFKKKLNEKIEDSKSSDKGCSSCLHLLKSGLSKPCCDCINSGNLHVMWEPKRRKKNDNA